MSAEEIVSLRDESIAAQRQRLELAQFKIVAIAAIGAVAIGASDLNTVPYIIGLIPLVAIYVDVISETKKIQFMAIGAFLNSLSASSIMAQYEKFADNNRSAFLRNYSYQYSTVVVSAAIALLGVGRLIVGTFMFEGGVDFLLAVVEISSGLLGVVASLVLNRIVARKTAQFTSARPATSRRS
jgi:hypothetical protein